MQIASIATKNYIVDEINFSYDEYLWKMFKIKRSLKEMIIPKE